MSKRTIIIEIEDLDVSEIDSAEGYAFRVSVQLMRDGHKVSENSIACYASRVYSIIGTWLAGNKHNLTA